MNEQRTGRGAVDTSSSLKGNSLAASSNEKTPTSTKVSKLLSNLHLQQHADSVSVNMTNNNTRNQRLAELNLKEEDLNKLEQGQQEGHIKTDLFEYQGEYVRHQGQTLKHGWGTLRFKTRASSLLSSSSSKTKSATTTPPPPPHPPQIVHNEQYTGQWWLDRRHGEGTYHFASGAVYRGQWDNDLAHGMGQFIFPSYTATTSTVPSLQRRKRKTSMDTPFHSAREHHTSTLHNSGEHDVNSKDRNNDNDKDEDNNNNNSNSGGHEPQRRDNNKTTTSVRALASSLAPITDFWANGVVLRLANTHFFAYVDLHANSKQQQLRALEGLYVNPRQQLLKEWETLWTFAERPPEGIYTCGM
jgi:hypothetical protein